MELFSPMGQNVKYVLGLDKFHGWAAASSPWHVHRSQRNRGVRGMAQLCFFVWRSYENGCPQLSFCWKAGAAYSW